MARITQVFWFQVFQRSYRKFTTCKANSPFNLIHSNMLKIVIKYGSRCVPASELSELVVFGFFFFFFKSCAWKQYSIDYFILKEIRWETDFSVIATYWLVYIPYKRNVLNVSPQIKMPVLWQNNIKSYQVSISRPIHMDLFPRLLVLYLSNTLRLSLLYSVVM